MTDVIVIPPSFIFSSLSNIFGLLSKRFFYDGWNDWPSTFSVRLWTKMESRSVTMVRKDDASMQRSLDFLLVEHNSES